MPEPAPTLTAWHWARALLLTGVVVLQGLDAVPLPEISRSDLRYPIAKDEIKRWAGVLTDLGRPTTPAELTDFALELGQSAGRLRKAVLGPTWRLRRVTGTGQAWGLFAYPDPYAGRLVVQARPEGGAWEVLYRAPEWGHGRVGALARYRRLRGIYDDAGDRPRPRTVYRRLARWLARDIFTRRPELDEVEVRLDMHRIFLPGEGEAVPDERRHARMHTRGELMADPETP